MGIFDNVQQIKSNTFDAMGEKQAWMSCMVSCMRFNKDVSSICLAKLQQLSQLSDVFANCNYVDIWGECCIHHMNYGPKKLIDGAIKYIQPEDCSTLFVYCAEFIFCGSIINNDRKEILQYLADKLSIHESTAKIIVEVTIIKCKRDYTMLLPSK